jgi:hypothetical protein
MIHIFIFHGIIFIALLPDYSQIPIISSLENHNNGSRNLPICLSVHLSVRPLVCLPICMSAHWYVCLFVCLPIGMYAHWYVCPSGFLPISLYNTSICSSLCTPSVHLSVSHMSTCPSTHFLICLCVHLSIFPYICLNANSSFCIPICLSVYLHLPICLSILSIYANVIGPSVCPWKSNWNGRLSRVDLLVLTSLD